MVICVLIHPIRVSKSESREGRKGKRRGFPLNAIVTNKFLRNHVTETLDCRPIIQMVVSSTYFFGMPFWGHYQMYRKQ